MFATTRTLIAFAILATASAAPSGLEDRDTTHTNVSPSISICSTITGASCVTVPIVSDTCKDLNGGLSFWNDDSSTVTVPGGMVCTLFDNFGCLTGGPNSDDVAVLIGRVQQWVLNNVPGRFGNINFDNRASSFTCSSV
ncbi:hypothetical protein B0H34DRAFT_182551 [Crassisporium funariophilum]|nr:hypothetical protein B0H34DRAFT_182551 [Crassisporium funariophilum]